MTKTSFRMMLLCIAPLFIAGQARAGLIFDNYAPNSALFDQTTKRDDSSGPLTFLTVQATTEVGQVGVLNNFLTDGQIRFVIADGLGNVLYQSAATSVAADATGVFTWKYSDPFAFTLEAGRSYYIGYIANVSTDAPFAGIATGVDFSQNGITSPRGINGNAAGFDATMVAPSSGTAVIPLQLFTAVAPAVPEPSGAVLLGLASALGFAAARVSRAA